MVRLKTSLSTRNSCRQASESLLVGVRAPRTRKSTRGLVYSATCLDRGRTCRLESPALDGAWKDPGSKERSGRNRYTRVDGRMCRARTSSTRRVSQNKDVDMDRTDGEPVLRVGIVGLGYWGPNLLRGLIEQPSVEVSYICDLERGAPRPFRPALSERHAHELATRICWRIRELDAIVIATPVFTHFELAAAALRAGKHTFVEKPLAPSTAEAERADRARRGAGSAPDVRADLPLQPAGESGQAPDRRRASWETSSSSPRAA